jgi:toxin ParE1/3/4
MLKKYDIDIEPEALDDIQNAVDYYDSKQMGLGKRFYNTVDKNMSFLKRNYHAFTVRYDDIRCMPVDKFPYMIHYRILENQETVSVKALFGMSESTEKWDKRII